MLLVVNDRHYAQFAAWARTWGIPEDRLVNDGSRSNEERPGAIACLALVLERHRALIGDRDVLVVAGKEEEEEGAARGEDHGVRLTVGKGRRRY